MAILIRDGAQKWKTLTPVSYSDESQLQKMLYESPELIPIPNDEAVAVFIREAGLPGSGSTDLIGVDSEGNILIVETKLARNQEVRRKVVGQILEYAAFLWQLSFDDFDQLFVTRRSKSVLALLAEQKRELEMETLRQAIRENLRRGRFQLLIAVDQINQELERIISYLSNCGGGIQLEALELELYVEGKMQVLVPRRYGPQKEPSLAPSQARILTIQEVLSRAEGVAQERLTQLVNLWGELSNRVEPGTQGASFKAEVADKWQPIFWAYPTSLQAAFGDLTKRGAPDDAVQEFRSVVAQFKAFDQVKVMNASQPMAKLAELSSDELKKFVQAGQNVVNKWREATVNLSIATGAGS